jgi:type IV pilus assembly protein PilC
MAVIIRRSGAEAAAARPVAAAARAAAGTVRRGRVAGARRIVNREVGPFTRQVASMMASGMSLVAALSSLHDQVQSPAFRNVVTDLLRGIEGGAPFSETLARYPSIFDDLYVNMVKAGERSGEFAPTMKRLAMMIEATAKLRRKVKSALTYPTVVMCMAVSIAFGIITFVVPVFASMYEDFGASLPGPTLVLLALSKFLRHNLLYVAVAVGVAVWLFRRWGRTDSGRYVIDTRILAMPVFGPLIQKVSVARFTRLLAQMLRSGVPILEAIELVAKASGNKVIERALMEARASVEQGGTITSGLENKTCLPRLMVRMVAAGEKSGRLDEMLDNVADTYDDEVDTMLTSLTSLMEPMLMVFLGVVIGGIVVSLFLPIFKMGEIVGRA